ncbi:CPBP family intramembrane glutamic endopeptidase [Stenotrophomonas oahuensis]|uniref:CPBP family intramembrane metalloprotease n=1 Tax=Stenotrophomonas oahuensis TaxID=3003271 RepID=A0ABY9YMU1_9GAMM|nr:CPBP family intramembrane glutamic endopeptidase [Stenotrophomonas sp. A5586]WNH52204.1 CPBP family intramembrane metalloprotease [Stenotrophomonas sp. A5586]
MDAVIFAVSFTLICAALFLLVRLFDQRIPVSMALLGALLLGLDDLVTGLASTVPALAVFGGGWNWSGKVYSLVLSVLVILALKLDRHAVGLTFKQRTPWLSVAAVLGFIVWGSVLGWVFQPGSADAETLAFQVTMPGLAEELVYRGVVPTVLLGAVWGRALPERGYWPVIIGTAIAFGLWHSLGYSKGTWNIDPMSGLFPFIGSLAGGWLRFRTGSLLVPVLGHGLANLAFHVVGGLAA